MRRGARRGLLANAIDGLVGNPTATGGGIVMLAMAAAIITNAVSLQAGHHPNPLFGDARPVLDHRYPVRSADPATTESIRPTAAIAAQNHAIVAAVQAELRSRGFYDGAVDGLSGPVTAAAIMRYEAAAGLPSTGEATDDLLDALRHGPSAVPPPAAAAVTEAAPNTSGLPLPRPKPQAAVAAEPADPIGALAAAAAATPAPRAVELRPAEAVAIAPRPVDPPIVEPRAVDPAPVATARRETPAEGSVAPIRAVKVQPIRIESYDATGPEPSPGTAVAAAADPRLARIQAALGDLGFGPLASDGVMNEATRAAIADFEAYRGLPRTGVVNERFLAELVAIGGLSLQN